MRISQTIDQLSEGRKIFIVVSDKVDEGKTIPGQSDVLKRLNDENVKKNIEKMIARTYATINAFLNLTGFKKQKSYKAPDGSNDEAVVATWNLFKSHFNNPDKCFQKYMGNNLDNEVINSMLLNIYLTITGMLQKTVYIKPYTGDEKNFGEVKKIWDNKKEKTHKTINKDEESKLKQFCADYREQVNINLEPHRIIHISLDRICDYPATLAVMTLLHEASHKFANTDDNGYFLNSKNTKEITDTGIRNLLMDVSAGSDNTIPLYVLNKKYDANRYPKYMDWRFLEPTQSKENADTVAAIIYHYGNFVPPTVKKQCAPPPKSFLDKVLPH